MIEMLYAEASPNASFLTDLNIMADRGFSVW